MGIILRWFHAEGRRYHAFLRATVRGTEMIIRSSGFSAVVPVAHGAVLDQFTEAELEALVLRATGARANG